MQTKGQTVFLDDFTRANNNVVGNGWSETETVANTAATINAAGGGTMVGTIIASAAVAISTVGNVAIVTINGRAMGLNASVTMTNTVINVPAQ